MPTSDEAFEKDESSVKRLYLPKTLVVTIVLLVFIVIALVVLSLYKIPSLQSNLKALSTRIEQLGNENRNNIGSVNTEMRRLQRLNGEAIAATSGIINDNTDSRVTEIIRHLDDRANALEESAGSLNKKSDQILAQAAASEAKIDDLRKMSTDQLAQLKDIAARPVTEPAQARSPEASPAKTVKIQNLLSIDLVTVAPDRNLARFPKGGASKAFSRTEIERLGVELAPSPDIKATLIFKAGLLKTWTRTVDIEPGSRFGLVDMKDAAQVVFWSDETFWVTWKKVSIDPFRP